MTEDEYKAAKAQEKRDGIDLPGSPEPVDGRCGAKLANSIEKYGTQRYDALVAGHGTPHLGAGKCKFHGGSTPNHLMKHEREKQELELRTIAQQLGEPEPVGPASVEGEILVRKMKQWCLIFERKIDELNSISDWDRGGVEHARVAIEILERGWDRLQKALEFYLKYDLDKKTVELKEYQAMLIGQAVFSVINDPQLGLTDDQMDIAKAKLVSAMRPLGEALEPDWVNQLNMIPSGVIEADMIE